MAFKRLTLARRLIVAALFGVSMSIFAPMVAYAVSAMLCLVTSRSFPVFQPTVLLDAAVSGLPVYLFLSFVWAVGIHLIVKRSSNLTDGGRSSN